MALQHRISDAVHMHVEHDPKGFPVIEIEFKYVRYRLVIDHKTNAEKLIELIQQNIGLDKERIKEAPELPKFYKEDKK